MRLLGTVPAREMRSSAVHFWPGDVLYGRLRPYLNKVYCPDFEGLASAEFIVFPRSDFVESRFIQYVLNSVSFVSFASHLNEGDRPRVDFDQIGQYVVSLPPLNEQRRIVAAIETQFTRLDTAVATMERSRANLKRYRAAVLKAACEGRLVPTEAELARQEGRDYEPANLLIDRLSQEKVFILGRNKASRGASATSIPSGVGTENGLHGSDTLPEGWIWATAEQVTSRITDGEHITPERSSSGVLLLSARNVHNGSLNLEQVDYVPERVYETLAKRLTIDPGDVLLSCSGTVGRSCVAPSNLRFALVRSVAVLKPMMDMGRYLSFAIRSPFVQAQIDEKKTQTAQANIFQGKIKTLVIPLPPLAEQQRIVAEVERRLSTVEELEKTVDTNHKRAERLRQAILARAFAGEIVLQDPTDEPASILLERIRAERATEMGRIRARRISVPRRVREQNTERRSLDDVLAEHPEGLEPLRLLQLAGFDEDSVDEFYAQLKVGIDTGKVVEKRTSGNGVVLGTSA